MKLFHFLGPFSDTGHQTRQSFAVLESPSPMAFWVVGGDRAVYFCVTVKIDTSD